MPFRLPGTSLIFFIFILSSTAYAQRKDVTVRVVQGDQVTVVEPDQNSLTLEKKSFKIQVLLQHIKGVYAFASLSDSLFRLPDADPVPDFANLPHLVLDEEPYNVEKELLVSRERWSYWFFDPGIPGHRFNKKIILLDSGRVVGSKTIKQLYILPDRLTIKLKDNAEPLYLLFVAVDEEDENGRPVKELLRRKIKIEWRDEE